MKKRWKKGVIYLLALCAARITMAGCYPVIAAFYMAAFLNDVNRVILFGAAYAGMLLFLPVNDMVKYAMIILAMTVITKLAEKSAKTCKTYIFAILTAVVTAMLTISGSLLQIRDSYEWNNILLESLFVFGFIMLADRSLFFFLQDRQKKERAKRNVQVRVENPVDVCAQSVRDLSEVFAKAAGNARQTQIFGADKIRNEMTGRICIGCEQCACCMSENKYPMLELMDRMLESLEKYGIVEAAIEEEMQGECIHTEELIAEALHIMECARLNQAWYHRLVQNQGVIAWQLDSISQMIEQAGESQRDISDKESHRLREVNYRLKELGIEAKQVKLLEKRDGHFRLSLQCASKTGRCISVKDVVPVLSNAMQIEMISHRENKMTIGKESVMLAFEEAPFFKELHGVARLTKQGEVVSGDNFSIMHYNEGELDLCLSDGMGSGMNACKESEMVLELVEKFLEAGFTQELGIQMMNSTMMLQGDDEQYSTIDIASINLYNGGCELYKIGAAPTFIKTKDSVECLMSTNLPVGTFTQPEIDRCSRLLEDSDMVVMMTDGVLDNLHTENPEQTMREIIESIRTNHPGKAAEEILKHVLLYTGGEIQDDMSVIVAGIWER